jgi:cyclopropane-fatty-acyl-phospholipid synthase
MTDIESGPTDMRPHFEEIQAHYDLSDEFFGLLQDS